MSAYKQIRVNCEKDYIYESIRGLGLFGARAVLKAKGVDHDRFQEDAGRMRDINEKSAAIKKINIEKEYLKTRTCFIMLDLQLVTILQEDIKSIKFNKELILQQNTLVSEKESELVEYY